MLALCSFGLSAQSQQREIEAPDLSSPATVAAGQKLYASACSACHGKMGEGGRGPNLSDGILIRRTNNPRLFGLIKNGVPGTDMPAFPIGDAKVWQVVAYLRSLSAPAIEAPPPGDVENGRAVFFGKGGCSNCHMIQGKGGSLGPDLSEAGATRTSKQLREGLVDPNARIPEGFRPVRAVTADGKVLEGIAKNYTNYSLQLIDRKGELHLIDTRHLKEVAIDNSRSPMPGDYAKKLSTEEIVNLVAFLSRQSMREYRPAATSDARGGRGR
jgi:cytochrome c oxidase cbb3-type subunit III